MCVVLFIYVYFFVNDDGDVYLHGFSSSGKKKSFLRCQVDV